MYLAVNSSAGLGYVKFEPKETYGWVFPVVMARLYNFWFVTPSEAQVGGATHPWRCSCDPLQLSRAHAFPVMQDTRLVVTQSAHSMLPNISPNAPPNIPS